MKRTTKKRKNKFFKLKCSARKRIAYACERDIQMENHIVAIVLKILGSLLILDMRFWYTINADSEINTIENIMSKR